VVRFYNNIQDRGDCQTPRKSYKTPHSVGWVVGWKKGFDCAVERATYLRAKPSRSPETQRPTQTSGEVKSPPFASDCQVRSRRQAPDAGWSDRGEGKSGRLTAPKVRTWVRSPPPLPTFPSEKKGVLSSAFAVYLVCTPRVSERMQVRRKLRPTS
jgi:hypothetical protein